MSITVTFDPPLPSDSPSVFNTKAFTLLGDLNDWSTEANALASTVNSNASTSATNASNASSSASAAATSASNASTSAGNASSSASAASSSASSASSSASAASTSASNASTSASAAAASAASINPSLLPSMRPSLLLDFANSRAVDGRITFTRASTATRTNANGLIETVASGVPRIDFDPITLACKGLLVEESRTNLLTYSQDFDNAAWTKTRSSITANAVAAPDGTTTADKLVEDVTASNSHFVEQVTAITSGTTYTFSVYAKAAERSRITLSYYIGTPFSNVFDLSSGVVVSGSGTGTITHVGGGWYRCTSTAVAVATGSGFFDVYLHNGTGTSYTGDGVSGLYLWGAQLEAGAFPTSYIPTTSAQVTRAADVATMTGANFSSWYRADEGSFVVSADMTSPSTYSMIAQVDDGTTGNRIYMDVFSSNARLASTVSSANQGLCTLASVSTNTAFTVAGAYKLNDYSASLNGATPGTDATGTIPTVSQLRISTDGANALNGRIARLAYYPKRLTNAELQALSA